jgi:5-methylthioadenosine/S-adenosylhomocysteine deaminase
VPFHIHLAESAVEQSMIADPQGASPVKHLEKLGLLDPDTVCVHCVWVDEEDLEILAERGTKVVICPQSHLKLASGMAPLRSMLDHQIPVALGTDGAASNNSLDLFREMDICAKVQKVKHLDPVAVPAADILSMTTGAAGWLSQKRRGELLPGTPADLIMVDLDKPHLQPFYGPDLLVYSAGGADVRHVIVDGKLRVLDGQLISTTLEEVKARVRELSRQPAT